MVQKVAVKHEFKAGLRHAMTGKLSLTQRASSSGARGHLPSSKLVPCSN